MGEGDSLMTKRCMGMSPITTEMIPFFLKNRDMWALRYVVESNNGSGSEGANPCKLNCILLSSAVVLQLIVFS